MKELKTKEGLGKVKKEAKGITMVVLVVTIIVLLILSAVVISLTVGQNGLFNRVKQAKEEDQKAQAMEALKLKILDCQMLSYEEKGQLPTLSYLASYLDNDKITTGDVEYVQSQSKQLAILDETPYVDWESIYMKLAKYPYEFEINSAFQVAINGEPVESAIPAGYMKIPTETLEIQENGNYDVTNYANAKVDVPIPEGYINPSGTLQINEKNTSIDVSNYQYADTSSLYTKSQYDNNYSLGFNAGGAAAWKKITENVNGANINSHELKFGYIPRFMFIYDNQSNGTTSVLFSMDSCKTIYRVDTNSLQNFNEYMKVSSTGVTPKGWTASSSVTHKFEIYIIK